MTKSRGVRPGVSLVEVVVSTLLVGLLLSAALMSVGASARSSSVAAENSDATYLALQLLEEISILPYEDPDQTPIFGIEKGESQGQAKRSKYDDIDDFDAWTESPPEDRDGKKFSNFGGWTRTVHVMQGANNDKTIRVTVTAPSGRSTTLMAVRTQAGGSLQPQGVNQTLITWIGVELQTGAGAEVTSGVSLTNHASDQ